MIKKVKHGVPQGYVIGLLCFLPYLNDMINILVALLPNIFADDTNIFTSGKPVDTMIHIIN